MSPPNNWVTTFWIYIKEKPSVRNTGLMMAGLIYFGQRDYRQSQQSGNVIKAYKELYEAQRQEKNELSNWKDKHISYDIEKERADNHKKDSIIMIMTKALQKK